MYIREEKNNKTQFMHLLLLADEEESMIDRYISEGRMFILEDEGVVKAECVITEENGVLEIKNLAVDRLYQQQGYGRAMIDFVCAAFREKYQEVTVGTGDSPATVPFYEKCGFVKSHVVKDFFTDNYTHPIYEAGVLLRDMVYLTKKTGMKG